MIIVSTTVGRSVCRLVTIPAFNAIGLPLEIDGEVYLFDQTLQLANGICLRLPAGEFQGGVDPYTAAVLPRHWPCADRTHKMIKMVKFLKEFNRFK